MVTSIEIVSTGGNGWRRKRFERIRKKLGCVWPAIWDSNGTLRWRCPEALGNTRLKERTQAGERTVGIN